MAARTKSSNLIRIVGLSILVLVLRTSQAEPPSPVSNLMTTAPPLPGYSRTLVTVDQEDTDIFHAPLIGNLSRIGFRTARADGGQFDNLNQYALFLDFSLPASWSPWRNVTADPRLTFEIGEFQDGSEGRGFVSLGPAVRFTNQRWRVPMFVDFGLSPTAIDGSRFEGRDLGTSLNFTSHIALGARFGKHNSHTVSLRYQHISNGGINNTNPGTNMIGLDFAFWSVRR